MLRVMSNGSSTPRSTRSDSFHSAIESMEVPSSSASVMDLASNWDWGEAETDVA